MKRTSLLITLVLIIGILAAACGTPPAPAETPEATAPQEQASATTAPAAPTPTPQPPEPAVGGTLVYWLQWAPDTLDAHMGAGSANEAVLQYVGASLVARDPSTGEYVPYLAKSWTVADDSLTWEFKLREDVKFHDGTPLTAHDFVWTYERAMEPDRLNDAVAAALKGVASFEAVDDYTLRFNMEKPNYYLLSGLTDPVATQPLSKDYIEQLGDEAYAFSPMGVGPYKFKEWVTDERIVLERNPDFAWGPEWTHGGAPFIETLEFRFVPEYATLLAGLETGELDYAVVESKDVDRVKATGKYHMLDWLQGGSGLIIMIHTGKAPFDDLQVRQALNYAIDREAILQVVGGGDAQMQQGPLTANVDGYWPGVEDIGYSYDLDKAKSLMEEAGYTFDAEGMLEKDGQPLHLVIKVVSTYEQQLRLAQVLQEQWKDLGVDLEIETGEAGTIIGSVFEGNYDMTPAIWRSPDASLLYSMYHSSNIGVMNMGRVNDPQLDQLLDAMVYATNSEENQEAAGEAQRLIVEKAYVLAFFSPINHGVLSNELQGVVQSPDGRVVLFDAYMETE